ncbi:TetR family transcriptional regulator [Paraconexibacter algicola]|uniref:TetR family transcriptional regulator n=1 Tax=Paraconexibacter algicola TaxID=2133960 RepID=A0A2T4UCX8_9ACTN|nr:TetR family transcriptional regulator [Paraconexibacter algicola]
MVGDPRRLGLPGLRGTRQGRLRARGVRRRAPYAQAAKELLRESLLDGARELLAERDWADVTMAQIAAAAGVSRQTVYNEFGSREEFAQALVVREAERFVAAVHEAVRANAADPVKALAAAFEVFLLAAEEDPLVRAVLTGQGSEELLALVTTQGEPVLQRATEQLQAVVLEHWDGLRPAQARLLSEAVVRLAISYATLPSGPSAMTAAQVSALLGPFVRDALGT